METIIFDHNATAWTKDREINEVFLNYQKDYLVELYLVRGYIYLNQIYEIFGIKWDPTENNPCWCEGRPLIIEFEPMEHADNEILVIIR